MKSFLNNKKLLIFDLDNTVLNEFDYIKAKLMRTEIVGNFDLDIKFDKLKKYYELNGNAGLLSTINEIFKLDLSRSDYVQMINNKEIPIYSFFNPIVLDAIEYFIAKNCEIWIWTNGKPDVQENKLQTLNHFFPQKLNIYFCSIKYPKPSPESLLEILGGSLFSRDDCIVIGDTSLDESAAFCANLDYLDIKIFEREWQLNGNL